jgi:ClpA/ClpB-like protein
VLRALVEDQDRIAAQVLRELGITERVGERLDEIMNSDGYRKNATPPNH